MPISSLPITAPADSGRLALGRTLPSLLDEASDRYAHPHALNQWHQGKWRSLSHQDLRQAAEEFALGLEHLNLHPGDPIALVMHSDLDFAIADMGTLLAGLVNVPIDLTQTIENILYILQHTQTKVLVVANLDLLYQIMPYFWETPELESVIVADVPGNWDQVRNGVMKGRGDTGTWGHGDSETDSPVADSSPSLPASSSLSASPRHPFPASSSCLHLPHLLCTPDEPCPPPPFPQCLQIFSLAEVRAWGRLPWSVEAVQELRERIHPQNLATLIYIASETQRPKGVMLSHENITANVLAAFSSYPNLQTGPEEVALLFLPLTHIFARVFLYGHLAYGHRIYLSDANHLVKHLRRVRPTIMITVPRLLEKVSDRILDQGPRLGRFDKAVFHWAVKLAQRFDVAHPPHGLYALQLQLADRLVFAHWREGFGGRLKACICGGAALRADLTQFFSAAGIPVFQGYGLTETSGVVTYNRLGYHRAGSVGVPIPGAEIALAADGEVLVKAPFVMQGYYRDPEATQVALDGDWLHTGDLGSLSADGFLTLTGVKKPLFKLSTGKYVSLLPLEEALQRSPWIAHAITTGMNRKFCGMVIFPNREALQVAAQKWGIDTSQPNWLNHPRIQSLYQSLIDTANCHLPYWSTVRQFALVDAELNPETDLLPNGSIDRMAVLARFAAVVEGMYGEMLGRGEIRGRGDAGRGEGGGDGGACPVYARSLLGK